jgi:hypothetical protein
MATDFEKVELALQLAECDGAAVAHSRKPNRCLRLQSQSRTSSQ